MWPVSNGALASKGRCVTGTRRADTANVKLFLSLRPMYSMIGSSPRSRPRSKIIDVTLANKGEFPCDTQNGSMNRGVCAVSSVNVHALFVGRPMPATTLKPDAAYWRRSNCAIVIIVMMIDVILLAARWPTRLRVRPCWIRAVPRRYLLRRASPSLSSADPRNLRQEFKSRILALACAHRH